MNALPRTWQEFLVLARRKLSGRVRFPYDREIDGGA